MAYHGFTGFYRLGTVVVAEHRLCGFDVYIVGSIKKSYYATSSPYIAVPLFVYSAPHSLLCKLIVIHGLGLCLSMSHSAV